MKRGQVFVRAIDPGGKWGPADLLDLDDESFRAVILHKLLEVGLFVGIKEETIDGDPITLRTPKRFPAD